MSNAFDAEQWISVFPGKMALSWRESAQPASKEQATMDAAKYGNTVAIPHALFRHLKKMEHMLVAAQRKLEELGFREDWIDGKPHFTELNRRHSTIPIIQEEENGKPDV